jgi:hypothetical protein
MTLRSWRGFLKHFRRRRKRVLFFHGGCWYRVEQARVVPAYADAEIAVWRGRGAVLRLRGGSEIWVGRKMAGAPTKILRPESDVLLLGLGGDCSGVVELPLARLIRSDPVRRLTLEEIVMCLGVEGQGDVLYFWNRMMERLDRPKDEVLKVVEVPPFLKRRVPVVWGWRFRHAVDFQEGAYEFHLDTKVWERVRALPPAEHAELRAGESLSFVALRPFVVVSEVPSRNMGTIYTPFPLTTRELADALFKSEILQLGGKLPPEIYARLLAAKLKET